MSKAFGPHLGLSYGSLILYSSHKDVRTPSENMSVVRDTLRDTHIRPAELSTSQLTRQRPAEAMVTRALQVFSVPECFHGVFLQATKLRYS